jgi:hypothetical protein
MEPPGEDIETTTVRLRPTTIHNTKTATLYRNARSGSITTPLCKVTNDETSEMEDRAQFARLSKIFPKGRLLAFASSSESAFTPVSLDYRPGGGEEEEDTENTCDAATVAYLEKFIEENICVVFVHCGDCRSDDGGCDGGEEDVDCSSTATSSSSWMQRLRIKGDVVGLYKLHPVDPP